ncbi:excinuclease ABC subunit UvrA [archaeon]|jgi:excinuclease ABC subunit A|nr:excinuclease ABC subunit UvrA [archaeon]MBT4351456.1 excinuclease ABC subunit UvrA [archaeon]MBT4647742.1 excinuclease ABC subunit UvrA [archaeon]MBT6821270.1 excinuclease ABC subunit UvrA [archaeon]MBT7392053.1 excinuclease ABC subunit UvrA [archaeon]
MQNNIVIKGAREHNLKNINITLPRNKFIVITGLSGSGKSSLAFDTIYAEGQRRYVESLSAYARQFLELMEKPDVDSIEGLSPAISIEQKTTSRNPRSTVGTVTEIYDYFRLLFARIGIPHCPKCDKQIKPQTSQDIVKSIIEKFDGEKIVVLAPLVRAKKGTYEKLYEEYHNKGYARMWTNENIHDIKEIPTLERYKKHDISVVIDRLKVSDKEISRLTESIENALKESEEKLVQVLIKDTDKISMYSASYSCPDHPEINMGNLEPRMFSFNSPHGACPECHGIGTKMEIDPDLVIPDKSKSIFEGAIEIYGKMDLTWRSQQLKIVGRRHGFELHEAIEDFTENQLNIVLYGSDEPLRGVWSNGANMNFENGFEGVIPQTLRLYKQTDSEYRRQVIEKFMRERSCETCKGLRLKPITLSVRVYGKNITDVTSMSIRKALLWFSMLKLNETETQIARQVMKEIIERLSFLNSVGVEYLTLDRRAGTLSGGEAQRIRLATQIGSNLTGVLYILDEPSIGLHQRDNDKLIATLKRLRDLGNTIIVVEHDEETMAKADHIVDLGPAAGVHGGEIVAQGNIKDIMKSKKSLTGQYLSGKLKIDTPKERRTSDKFINIYGAEENNLKNIDVKIPQNILTLITGVSGSGKSTLINDTLFQTLHTRLYRSREKPGKCKDITSDIPIDNAIILDQTPIGKTPRSNPATYTKLFDPIRQLFTMTEDSKLLGFKAGRFSFNVPGGRCENCKGDGLIKIEMNFLPDVYVKCEDCKGKRYNAQTLKIKYKGKNIADVLDMSIEEGSKFFENIPSINRKLKTLNDVGLGYMKLGQSSTTLSGGEAQRIKITRELSKKQSGQTVYILDEPTTGLHFEDIKKLLNVLNRLVDKNNTVILIEHNLDVIKSADHIIDLGPEGGDGGGTIIAEGSPSDIANVKESYTGQYLKKVL